MTSHSCTTIDGIVFDALDEASAVSMITDRAVAGRGGFVITPNASILRQLRAPEHAELAASADLVLADGMPIVWASRLTDQPLPERVCGSELIWSLSEAAAEQGLPVMLLGGEDGVAERGAAELARRVPGLQATWHFPPWGFDSDSELMGDLLAAVDDARARVVFVGLGFPKQERLIMALRSQFPDVWFIACGAALTFAAGDISRAPAWMREHGVEWVHRLVKEPRRLARRYLFGDIPFATAMFARLLWLKLGVMISRPTMLPAVVRDTIGEGSAGTRPVMHLLTDGATAAESAAARARSAVPGARPASRSAGASSRRTANARRSVAEVERAS